MEEELKTIETVDTSPFKHLVMTLGELPTSFVDSMTYYECLAWLVNFIQNTVIPTVNNNAEAVEELQTAFTTLKNYVDTYFDNLDVQEEINNKLDAMVEDGYFDTIAQQYLSELTEKVEYIFPKNWNAYSGDVAIIRGYSKVIMIDTFLSANKNDLYQMLTDFNITHIDYLILTHYHSDHIGNVTNLITDGYLDTTSYIYIPPDCQQIVDSPELTATKNEIMLAIVEAQIPHSIPAENSKLTINDEFDIEFYNTDFSALSSYTNYNNCSTICKVNHCGKKSLFTADALGQALDRALTTGFLSEHVDLYKVEHHGIEYNNGAVDALLSILPDYAYLPSFIKGAEENQYAISTTLAFLKSKECAVYASHLSTEYIVFQSAFGNFSVISGKESNSISNNNYIDNNVELIYVDANTTDTLQNGSSSHPFKDLPQAIGACNTLKSGRIEIALRNGTYCFAHPDNIEKNNPKANNIDVYITKTSDASIDNVIIKGSCDFFNSKVTLKNISFISDSTTEYNLLFNNCNVEIDNVKFNGSARSSATGIKSTKSDLYIHGCNAQSYNYFFAGNQDIIDIKDNTFNTISIAIMSRGGIILGTGNTYTDVTNNYANNEGGIASCNLKSLYTGSATSGSISFARSITNFNKMIVISGTTTDHTLSTDIELSELPDNFKGSTVYTIKTLDGYYTFSVASNGRSATITANNTTIPIKKILVELVNLEAI